VEQVIAILGGLHPIVNIVLVVLGALVVLGGVYVKLTPNTNDDAWWAKLEQTPVLGALLQALVKLSPVQRKDQ
jgi:hypothetical protein